MFRSLLVPLDGAPLSEAVLPMAAFLAKRAGARVTLLHVVERHAPSAIHGQRHLTSGAEAEAYLQEVAAKFFSRTGVSPVDSRTGVSPVSPPEVAVTWHVHHREIADVAHSLADHAGELAADLVIMLSHGHKQFYRWLFGTVAQQVLRQSLAPVLLLHPGRDGTVPVPFRQVLVPLDGRAEHEVGLPAAVELARLASAPLHLLMVVPTPSALGGEAAATGQLLPTATREMLELAEQEGVPYLQGHVERLQEAGLAATAAVARGEPADVIRETAARLAVDLIVLGTHGTAGVEAFWSGSLGQKLLGRVPASFLLVPAKAAGERPSEPAQGTA
jgi:nucleotide-binding universal stress UspA family protein